MQGFENAGLAILEHQITERFGLRLTQTQMAELLGRTTGGLRCSSAIRR